MIIFDKYNQIKNNNAIYKKIWSIKNNMERNNYINYIYSTVIKNKFIHQYYQDNPSVGMPKQLHKLLYTIYFNKYTYRFNITINAIIYNKDSDYYSKIKTIQSITNVLPDNIIFKSDTNYYIDIIHKSIAKYFTTYEIYLDTILKQLSHIIEIQSNIKSFLI